jgi:hypothetical protein
VFGCEYDGDTLEDISQNKTNKTSIMEIEVLLKKPELNYDVNLKTHIIANREASIVSAEQAWNYSNTDDTSGELNLINRYMENAFNELIAALGRYLPGIASFASNNDLSLAEVEAFDFLFDVPDTYNTAYINPLRSSMHQFIVSRTLYDWFFETKPDEAMKYREQYETHLEKARGYMNKRTKPIRTKPYPPF